MSERKVSHRPAVIDAAEFRRWDETLFNLMNQHPTYRPTVCWTGDASHELSQPNSAFVELWQSTNGLGEFISTLPHPPLGTGSEIDHIICWARQVCGPKQIGQESSRCEINIFALIRAALRSSFVPLIHGNNWRVGLQDDFDQMMEELEWFPESWCGTAALNHEGGWDGTPGPDEVCPPIRRSARPNQKREPRFAWGQDHPVHDAVKQFLYALPEGEFDRDDRLDRNFKQPIGRAWFGLVNACSQRRDDAYLLAMRQELVTQLRQWFAVVGDKTPESGWNFLPGEATFRGVRFEIQGVLWRLLKKLAERPGTPIGKSQLLDEVAADGNTGEEAFRAHLTRLRAILRSEYRLSNERDPLPNVERGDNAAWRLDEKVFPSVSQIKRWLNAR